MAKACWQWYGNYEVRKTLIQVNPWSDRWWNQDPERPLSVGLVGYSKPQEWREASFSNLICSYTFYFWIMFIFPNAFCLLLAHSPFTPALQGRHSRGFCFSWVFLAEQTEAQCGCWPPITQPATLGRGLPIVCVRQGREGSQFLWWNPPTNGRKSAGCKQGSLLTGLRSGAAWSVHAQSNAAPLPGNYSFLNEPQMFSSAAH